MAIHITKSKLFDEEKGNLKENAIHYFPCKINFEGSANVSRYFTNLITKNGDENNGLTASFRGYPLNGCIVSLPEGYKGLILKETVKPVSGTERTFHVTHTFQSLTYWNWDKIPSKDDAFLSALDWTDIAEAIHSPVQDLNKEKIVCNSSTTDPDSTKAEH
ncbi:ribonuclease H2 subunit C [Lycorma delicatula]|uniref:ribonuclease H2 subunit C n=1 Tax=Lycorma delicatula TaxID=130591 RepID=UPI003F510D60